MPLQARLHDRQFIFFHGANEMDKSVYNPRIMRNLVEICAEMGVGKETVKAWIDQGAPIVIEKDGNRTRYSAELVALQNWRIRQSQKGGRD